MTVRISYEVVIRDDVENVRSPTIDLEHSESSPLFEALRGELADLHANLCWLVDKRIIQGYEITVSIEEGEK